MKGTAKYVGLDVHQATTVASVRDECGRVVVRAVVPTEARAIVEFLCSMRGGVHVAFEVGTQSQWMRELVGPFVDRVVVCDPRHVARQGNKGDRVDADRLSELLRLGGLRAVYVGSAHCADLRELVRIYRALVGDSTRVMFRIKALYRAQGIEASGCAVYSPTSRGRWLVQLTARGVRFRAETLYAELDVLRELRAKAKAMMVAEARRDAAWPLLQTVPFFGPVRVSVLLAIMGTPWRFRTKRNLWAYAGLAVQTWSSADHKVIAGQVVRQRRAPLTRGLNRNYNRVLKDVFKGAATSAAAQPGPLQDLYAGMVARGMREELARLTLTRKIAALTLRLWKKGERYDPAKLTMQAS